MPKILHMMVGLPRSGKSTVARAMGYPIVNPDSIRLSLHGQAFYSPAEPFVWATAKLMVASLFQAGHENVILDATNTTTKRRAEWENPAWVIRFHVLSTRPSECIRRALLNQQPELVPVIERMAASMTFPEEILPPEA